MGGGQRASGGSGTGAEEAQTVVDWSRRRCSVVSNNGAESFEADQKFQRHQEQPPSATTAVRPRGVSMAAHEKHLKIDQGTFIGPGTPKKAMAADAKTGPALDISQGGDNVPVSVNGAVQILSSIWNCQAGHFR
ncbi:hypothetical protein pipiens_017850 [Culex pipiens pipiens]|uniref:Uncharacterized protein n=1 Tax=Culex pipiens pipiens TaxID=38569 RepID=A0ABD1CEN9_CULPP